MQAGPARLLTASARGAGGVSGWAGGGACGGMAPRGSAGGLAGEGSLQGSAAGDAAPARCELRVPAVEAPATPGLFTAWTVSLIWAAAFLGEPKYCSQAGNPCGAVGRDLHVTTHQLSQRKWGPAGAGPALLPCESQPAGRRLPIPSPLQPLGGVLLQVWAEAADKACACGNALVIGFHVRARDQVGPISEGKEGAPCCGRAAAQGRRRAAAVLLILGQKEKPKRSIHQ